ncbi:MAG TPA: DEAD/DEAH box helicase [Planctomycetota bacterium]
MSQEPMAPIVPEPMNADGATDPFAAVPAALRPALRARGFTALTAVQTAALAAAGAGEDLRISSQTGSGKTVALGFVMAPRLLEPRLLEPKAGGRPQALVIVPTRELAAQVREELQWLYASVRGVSLECVTGGTSILQEQRRLARGPSVVVGTPGRLLDHIRSGALDCSGMCQVVLDEADQMLDLGFRDDLEAILGTLPAERRTHLMSATLPAGVLELADRYQSAARHVEGTRLGAANADIAHVAHVVRPRERFGALVNLLLLATDQRTLVFVRTRMDSTALAEQLAEHGFAAAPISGELAQAQRTRTLSAFRQGTVSVLVATDVAARGLDIANVPMVVHFDPPIDSEVYTHRSGRTGRAGKQGTSVLFAPQAAQRRVEGLCRGARVKLEWRDLPTAASVRAELARREKARVVTAVEAPDAMRMESAKELLTGRDPVQVVAGLLGLCATAAGTREPYEVTPAMEPQRPFRQRERVPASDFQRAPRRAGFTRFSINWGRETGASPQRLLAHVCRRGDVDSRAIRGIDIGALAATFEVASELAAGFARRVQGPDRRDPGVHIRALDDDNRSQEQRPASRREVPFYERAGFRPHAGKRRLRTG